MLKCSNYIRWNKDDFLEHKPLYLVLCYHQFDLTFIQAIPLLSVLLMTFFLHASHGIPLNVIELVWSCTVASLSPFSSHIHATSVYVLLTQPAVDFLLLSLAPKCYT